MSQIRQFSWYVQAFFGRHKQVIGISVISGIMLFILVPQLVRVLPTVKRTTYVGRVGRFSLSQMPRDIQEKVSFGLTQSFENGDVVPALASAFTREEGGKSYRFTIRPHVNWQDGKPVTPADINYAFSDTQVSRSQNDIVFRLVAKKQDENAQDPVLPISFLSIVSQPLFRQQEYRTFLGQKRVRLIGLSDYQITNTIDQGSGITELTLDSVKDRLVYRFYPTEHAAIVAFKRGEVDRLEGVSDTEDLATWNNVKVTPQVHNDQYVGIFFNLQTQENQVNPLSNKPIRQALNYALVKPTANRVISPINRKSWAYVAEESDLDSFNQDMSQAVDLLSKAETPTKLVFDLQTLPVYAAIADGAKQNWEELGRRAVEACKKSGGSEQCDNKQIQVNIRITGYPDTQNFQILIAGQQIPKDPDQYVLWHSTQPTNITHYKNPRVDKLLEDGRRTAGKEERKLIYQEFQRVVVKDVPVIFLQSITTFDVTRGFKLL